MFRGYAKKKRTTAKKAKAKRGSRIITVIKKEEEKMARPKKKEEIKIRWLQDLESFMTHFVYDFSPWVSPFVTCNHILDPPKELKGGNSQYEDPPLH